MNSLSCPRCRLSHINLSGLAITALRHAEFLPRHLHRLRTVRRQASDRGDRSVRRRRHRGRATAHRLGVQVNRTRAAQPHATTELRAFEVEFVTQHLKQRRIRVAVKLLVLTGYSQLNHKISSAQFVVRLRRPLNCEFNPPCVFAQAVLSIQPLLGKPRGHQVSDL